MLDFERESLEYVKTGLEVIRKMDGNKLFCTALECVISLAEARLEEKESQQRSTQT